MKALSMVAKAIVAALVAGYAVYQVATGTGSPAGELVTSQEWVNVGVTTVLAGVAVWAVPNEPQGPAA